MRAFLLISTIIVGAGSGCLAAMVTSSPIMVQPDPGAWFIYRESGTNATYRIEILSDGPGLGSGGEIVDSTPIRYEREGGTGASLALERLEHDSHRRFSTLVECRPTDKNCPRGWRDVEFRQAEGAGFLGTSELWGGTIESLSQLYEIRSAPHLGVGCHSIQLRETTPANPRFERFPILYEPNLLRWCPGDRAPREIENREHIYRLSSSGHGTPNPAPSLPDVERFAAARDRLEWAGWDRRTPPLGPPFEAFTHIEAVRWLDANDSAYREFLSRHPDAFVRMSFLFDSGGGGGVVSEYQVFERKMIFQAANGDIYHVVLEKIYSTTLGVRSEKIVRGEWGTTRAPVDFDAMDASPILVTFESAHRWAKSLMGRAPAHTALGISHDPYYRFNFRNDFGGEGGVSVLESMVVNATTGKLERLEVAGHRWG